MKAFRLVRPGEEGQLQEVAVPDPGPGQVLVKIAGAGLCHSDLHFQEPGFPRVPFLLERTPGHLIALASVPLLLLLREERRRRPLVAVAATAAADD